MPVIGNTIIIFCVVVFKLLIFYCLIIFLEIEEDGNGIDTATQKTRDRDDDLRGTAELDVGVKKKIKCDSSKWKKNVRKIKRVKGEAYIGASGKEVPSRPLLPVPCEGRRRHKCLERRQ